MTKVILNKKRHVNVNLILSHYTLYVPKHIEAPEDKYVIPVVDMQVYVVISRSVFNTMNYNCTQTDNTLKALGIDAPSVWNEMFYETDDINEDGDLLGRSIQVKDLPKLLKFAQVNGILTEDLQVMYTLGTCELVPVQAPAWMPDYVSEDEIIEEEDL